jgi:hypothetical protein
VRGKERDKRPDANYHLLTLCARSFLFQP